MSRPFCSEKKRREKNSLFKKTIFADGFQKIKKTKRSRFTQKLKTKRTPIEKLSGKSVCVTLSDLVYVNAALLRKIFKPYIKIFCMRLIIFYQRHLSRHTCLYSPTCSQYTLECINNRGVIEGILLGAFRILRCNPFSKGGFDPPIESRYKKWVL